jgi:2-hydroxycyclohexanecarboxyl-CoA dehydrogenase
MSANARPVLVTGAGRGIGEATALRLAADGLPVAVTDRDAEAAADVAARIRDRGGSAVHAWLDVTDTRSARAAIAACTQKLGGLGALVNNAGWSRNAPLEEQSDELIDELMAINLVGTLRMCREALPVLRAWGSGRIVNLASDSARAGMAYGSAYTAAKGGVLALTRSLARELARHDVTVNCVSPGVIDTPLYAESMGGSRAAEKLLAGVPLRRLGEPQEVAGAVAFLLGNEAAYITGQSISVNGGLVIG